MMDIVYRRNTILSLEKMWIMAKKKKVSVIYVLLMGICAVTFLVSSGLLIKKMMENKKQDEAFEEISSMFIEEESSISQPLETQTAEEDSVEMTALQWMRWWEETAKERYPVYQSLKAENDDFAGWVKIEGTRIDYPVMYTPGRPEYYLHLDFYKRRSSYGTPFLDDACRLEESRTNLLLYGHHMKNGSMFADLQNYTKQEYFSEHPYVQFDLIDQAGSYEIAAVVRVNASSDQTPWRELLFSKDEEEFDQAWKQFCRQRYYDTGVELTAEDELLALVTCEYTQKDGRLMVIARRIREE